jgi:hypothetical protein
MDNALIAALIIVALIAGLYYTLCFAPTCRANGSGHLLPDELDPLEHWGRVGTRFVLDLVTEAFGG